MSAAARPARASLANEARGLFELPRLVFSFPFLALKPRGWGQRVLVLPGYGAGDASTAVLQSYLRWLGYRAEGWGLGRNTGDVPALLPQVVERVEEMADAIGRPVPLVGWSLGGYFAREVARDLPDVVDRVITLGTPVLRRSEYAAATLHPRYHRPIERPITAIFSRADAVVPWERCIDQHSRDVEHVEVGTTHVGLGFSPEVFGIIADRLAGRSRPERDPAAPAGEVGQSTPGR